MYRMSLNSMVRTTGLKSQKLRREEGRRERIEDSPVPQPPSSSLYQDPSESEQTILLLYNTTFIYIQYYIYIHTILHLYTYNTTFIYKQYYIILYNTTFIYKKYYIILYDTTFIYIQYYIYIYTILHYTMQHYIILYNTTIYYTILHYTIQN